MLDRIDQRLFDAIYSRSLVYNTCWEDPAVDRQALQLRETDHVLAITSAGCNVLDYALAGACRVDAVDANPRQNALLELKLAGIQHLDFDDFFALFGHGYHARFPLIYKEKLRGELGDFAREFWDARCDWFAGRQGSFYYHSLSGLVARAFRAWFRMRPELGSGIAELFSAGDVEEQRRLYRNGVRARLWTAPVNWLLERQITMSLLGVPYPQRREVQAQHPDGVAGFVREAVEYIIEELPLADNYFWRVYFGGRYTPTCCPEYLKESNFLALKGGRAEAIRLHTCLITEFLSNQERLVDKFVLLDHMDWMSCYYPDALIEEWNLILERAAPGGRIIFRSAHARPAYLDWIEVGEAKRRLRDQLVFQDAMATALSKQDRVHTYAGFHICDVPA